MKTKLLCCAMAFVGSLMMTGVYAQQAIVACNGKNYEQGDTLIIGKPASSGYLFMRTVDEQGSLSSVYERDIDGLKVVITSIPGYDKNYMSPWEFIHSLKSRWLSWLKEEGNASVSV